MTPDDFGETDEDETADVELTPGRQAESSLRRARKVAGRALDDEPVKSRFLLEEARIRAMLEVAEAVRGR